MALLSKSPSTRKRTKRFDLEAAAREGDSRLVRAFAGERLLDTLVAILSFAVQVLVVTAGMGPLDEVTIAGVGVVLAITNVAFALFLAEHHHELLVDRRRLMALQGLTILAFVVARVFVSTGWPIYLYPLALFGIALSIAFGQRLAITWSVMMAAAIGLMKGFPGFRFSVAATLAGGTLIAILVLGPRVSRRAKVIRAGIFAGVAYALLILATQILLGGRAELVKWVTETPRELGLLLGLGFLNGLFTGYFMVEFGLRVIEVAFDVVTDLRLQELADLNQPILKKFALEAPGTFHHSQMVGTLAETGAEAIGGNALLCRVGAHFHDIGKMAKPEYYIENVTAGGPTKHDGLAPSMSTLIIVSHVKDGIEMAEELGLPACVIDCIPEHHGTIAVEYFFHQAVKQQKKDGGPEVSRDDFRYPGPKPQSRETAILMIADSVEAISRVLTEPNPARIEGMIHDVVMRRFSEGQLDECAITLAELKKVEDAMARVLCGIFHGRIKYPKAAGVDRPSESDAADVAGTTSGSTPVPGSTSGTTPVPGPAYKPGTPGTSITIEGAGSPEDTNSRIRAAALQADGPGIPGKPGEERPIVRSGARF